MIKKNMSIIIVVATLLLLAAVIFGINYLNATNYVATMAGEKITNAEYNFFLASVKMEMENEADEASKEGMWNNSVFVEDAKKEALNRAKEFKIQVIKAKEQGVTLGSEDMKYVDSVIQNFLSDAMQSLSGSGVSSANLQKEAEKEFKNTYRVSTKQYRKILEQFMLVSNFAEQEQEQLDADEGEIKTYYDENTEDFEMYTLRHIMFFTVDTETGLLYEEDKLAEIKAKAEDTMQKVKDGEDMAELAKELSDDPYVQDSEGMLTVYKGSGYDSIEEWAFSGKDEGDIGILETEYSYHVIRVERKSTYDDMKENVRNVVIANKYEAIVDEWAKDPKYDVVKNGNVLDKVKI